VTELRVLTLTREAARRLSRAEGPGRVHSAFDHALNVEIGTARGETWISLHTRRPIPSPFGLCCETRATMARWADVLVRVDGTSLALGGELRVSWVGAVVRDTALPLAAPMPPLAACLARALEAGSDGLAPVVAAVVGRGECEGRRGAGRSLSTPLAQIARPLLGRLGEATVAGDTEACLGAAQALLGLGPGLTPSGDDCVCGWLTGLVVGSPRGRCLAERVGPGLLRRACGRTGPLSVALLAAVVAGQVAEPVHRFVMRPDAPGLEALLALGATSGADLLAGYLLARHALAGDRALELAWATALAAP